VSKADIRRGKFISFEGGEGVGKSTQVGLLRDQLAGRGIDVLLTREPGGSGGAEEIRKLLVSGDPDKWTPMTEVLLFYAARVDHLQRTILPALEKGQWVISDRYADSTFAYQGVGHGLDVAIVREIHRIATDDVWPDMTIILDADPAQGLDRANMREAGRSEKAREDRFERMNGGFHARLRQAFLEIARADPARCRIISAEGPMEEVANRIWRQVAVSFGLT